MELPCAPCHSVSEPAAPLLFAHGTSDRSLRRPFARAFTRTFTRTIIAWRRAHQLGERQAVAPEVWCVCKQHGDNPSRQSVFYRFSTRSTALKLCADSAAVQRVPGETPCAGGAATRRQVLCAGKFQWPALVHAWSPAEVPGVMRRRTPSLYVGAAADVTCIPQRACGRHMGRSARARWCMVSTGAWCLRLLALSRAALLNGGFQDPQSLPVLVCTLPVVRQPLDSLVGQAAARPPCRTAALPPCPSSTLPSVQMCSI